MVWRNEYQNININYQQFWQTQKSLLDLKTLSTLFLILTSTFLSFLVFTFNWPVYSKFYRSEKPEDAPDWESLYQVYSVSSVLCILGICDDIIVSGYQDPILNYQISHQGEFSLVASIKVKFLAYVTKNRLLSFWLITSKI